MTRTYSQSDPEKVRAFAIEAARTLADLKSTDVVVLDVRGHSQVSDYVVIGSGTSQRQMKSVATQVEDVGDIMGMAAFRSSRDTGTTWVVVDCVEVVIHLFEPDQRLYYDLELMWAQASRVHWERDASDVRPGGKKLAKSLPVASDDDDDQMSEAAGTKIGGGAGSKVSKKLGTKKAATKKVAEKKTVTKKSVTKEPVTKKPVTKKTVTKKLASKSKAAPRRSARSDDE